MRTLKRSSRLLLLICLMPILAAATVLCVQVPECFVNGTPFHLHHDRQHAIAFLRRGPSFDNQWGVLKLDLRTGQLEELYDEESYDDSGRNAYSHLFPRTRKLDRTTTHPLGWDRYEVRWLDEATDHYGRPVEFDFPDVSWYVIGNRFVVGHTNDQFMSLDLDNIDGELKTLDHRGSELPWVPLIGTDRFMMIRHEVPPGKVNLANPITRQVELLTIDESGTPTLIKTWPVGAINQSNFGAASYFGPEIASISPDLKHVQFHSAIDGSLVNQIPLPAGFDPQTMNWGFAEHLTIQLPDETHVLDYLAHQWLPHPAKGNYELVNQFPDLGRLLYLKKSTRDEPLQSGQVQVIDSNNGETIATIDVARGSDAGLVDADHLAIVSDQAIFSATLLDIKTGRVLEHWSPYSWVLPTLIATLMGYLVWLVAWIYASANRLRRAWIDAVVIGGIPVAFLIARSLWRGSDHHLVSLDYVQGILTGGFFTVIVVTILGRTRLSLRFLPLLLFASLVLAISSLVHSDYSSADFFIGFIGIHSLIVIGVAFVARATGWRLTDGETDAPVRPVRKKTSIQDLMWGLLCIAVLFAAMRVWYDRFSTLPATNIFWNWLQVTVALSVLTIIVALQPSRRIFAAGVIAALILYATLAYEPIWRVVVGHAANTYDITTTTRRVSLTAVFSLATFASVYRVKGRRLVR